MLTSHDHYVDDQLTECLSLDRIKYTTLFIGNNALLLFEVGSYNVRPNNTLLLYLSEDDTSVVQNITLLITEFRKSQFPSETMLHGYLYEDVL